MDHNTLKINGTYKWCEQISGSDYVIDIFGAALWCFNNTDTFSDVILRVANLGDDANITATVFG